MNYVEDTGTVVMTGPQKASVKLDHEQPEKCGSCCACSIFGNGSYTIDVDRGELREGDRVRVRIPRVNEYLSMLLVFGLPLGMFMGGVAVGTAFEADKRVGAASVVGGAVGLVVAFLVAWIVNRLVVKKAAPRAERLE